MNTLKYMLIFQYIGRKYYFILSFCLWQNNPVNYKKRLPQKSYTQAGNNNNKNTHIQRVRKVSLKLKM